MCLLLPDSTSFKETCSPAASWLALIGGPLLVRTNRFTNTMLKRMATMTIAMLASSSARLCRLLHEVGFRNVVFTAEWLTCERRRKMSDVL